MSGARGFDLTPDGRRVVWTISTTRSRDDLYVADVNGGSPTRVTAVDDDSRKRFPIWNAAGTGVIYLSNRGGQQDLWELDTKSSQFDSAAPSSPEVERPESTAQNGSRSYQVTEEKTTLFIWKAGDAARRRAGQLRGAERPGARRLERRAVRKWCFSGASRTRSKGCS